MLRESSYIHTDYRELDLVVETGEQTESGRLKDSCSKSSSNESNYSSFTVQFFLTRERLSYIANLNLGWLLS